MTNIKNEAATAAPSRWERLRQSLLDIRYGTAWPEEIIIVSSALVVGLGTGLGAAFFIRLLAEIQRFSIYVQGRIGLIIGTLLIMGLAGLVVGYMIEQWASEAKGHGVPEVMEAIAINGGHIRPRVAIVKIFASALTIGTGGSAGREGPIVQVGAALGSTLGQIFKFSDERIITLVACGSAAGIAATFNAPIAGTIFAMEVILSSFTIRYFGAVVISAVSASIVSRAFLGNQPAFSVPSYPLSNLGEIPIYILLGILSAGVAVLFIKSLYGAEEVFDNWNIRMPYKTAIGLLLTAAVGLLFPHQEVLGPGVHAIGETIAENINVSIGFLAALLVGKLLATTFTLGSGNSGGVFAPGLFMGAALGGIVGTIAHSLWPGVAVNPGAYAIVGMAAVFAGAARAPITAVLIVFEMSNDYKLILPLMLATVLSTLIAELTHPESIYTLKLKLKGISLFRGRDVDVLQAVTVREVMTTDVKTVPKDISIVELSDRFGETHTHGFPVMDDDGSLYGLVTIGDLDRAVARGVPRRTTVAEICTPRDKLIYTTPHESVGEALARMGTRGLGRLPVLDERDSNKLVGVVRRGDIIRAYNIALTRRAEIQHRTKRMRLRNIDGTEFVEIHLDPDDRVVGRSLQEVAAELPREAILVSVRRRGKVLIPHGDTIFQPGDQVTAFVRSQDIDTIKAIFGGSKRDGHVQIERNVTPDKTIIS